MSAFWKRAGAATLLPLAAVVVFASPAQAESITATCGLTHGPTGWKSCGKVVIHDSPGAETIEVRDLHQDGHSVVAWWHDDGTGDWGTVWNPNGAASVMTEWIDFREGSRISFRACAGEAGSRQILTDTCGSWAWITT